MSGCTGTIVGIGMSMDEGLIWPVVLQVFAYLWVTEVSLSPLLAYTPRLCSYLYL